MDDWLELNKKIINKISVSKITKNRNDLFLKHCVRLNKQAGMSFVKSKLSLSPNQKSQLSKAVNAGMPVSLRISAAQMQSQSDLVPLLLTKTQVNRIANATQAAKGLVLKMSKTQIQANRRDGGFLPFLIPALIAIGTAVATGAAGAAGSIAVKKIAEAAEGKGLAPLGTTPKPSKSGAGSRSLSVTLEPVSGIGAEGVGGEGLFPIGATGQGLFPIGSGCGHGCKLCPTCRGSGLFPIGVRPSGARRVTKKNIRASLTERSGDGLFPTGVRPR